MVEKERCTGCAACAAACPAACISMVPDGEGFAYPRVEEERCLHCGRCVTVCPVEKMPDGGASQPLVYAAMAKDDPLRLASSSGGIFSLLAEEVLARGGVVFGAAFAADCRSVLHIAVEEREKLSLLRGAKYIQSDAEAAYGAARTALQQGRWVLFSGTPCQIAGLKAFLGQEMPKLLTQDVLCHGVPSAQVWQHYLDGVTDAPVSAVSFRDKAKGWQDYALTLRFGEKSSRSPAKQNPYLQGYVKNLFLRPSCYHCPVEEQNYTSDITLGDFWGIDEALPGWNDGKGTSVVVLHTQRGREWFQYIQPKMRCQPVALEAAMAHNPAYYHRPFPVGQRKAVLAELNRSPFSRVYRKYAKPCLPVRVLRKLKRCIGR